MNEKLITRNSDYRILHSQFFSVFSKGDKKIRSAL